MRSRDCSRQNLVLDVGVMSLNVLLTLMKVGIPRNKDSGLIITIYGHWKRRRDVEIFNK